jgi:predicted RNase H-like HicB family nuclease
MFAPKVAVDTKVKFTGFLALEGDTLFYNVVAIKDKDNTTVISKAEVANSLVDNKSVEDQVKNIRWAIGNMLDGIRTSPELVKAELSAGAEIAAKREAEAKEAAAKLAAEAQAKHDEEVRAQLLAELKEKGQYIEE